MELKLEQQFKKGALEMVLLSLIARQRSYGYELISRLQREGGGLFQETKEGTLYPILYRLEDEGLSKASWRQTAAGGSKSIIRLLIWGFPP